jgi:hypothetical protein
MLLSPPFLLNLFCEIHASNTTTTSRPNRFKIKLGASTGVI